MAGKKTREHQRLEEARHKGVRWRRWGPYLSERQWGTVREDRSPNGDAWNSFSHDQARSRAYEWGEDGLAGFADDSLALCLALALWNGNDSILKERLFGLTNSEGNHGEDVKEYYFYTDGTPTHSYMRMLYKYPHLAFPYEKLLEENRRRGREELEYELLDTGIFDNDRYFDVDVEYAKESPEELLARIIITNRGSEPANLDVLPHLWFRNTWWRDPTTRRPSVEEIAGPRETSVILARHPTLGDRYLYCKGADDLLFTNNETNQERLFGRPNTTPHVKDGINDYIVHGRSDAVNEGGQGTKSAARYHLSLDPGETQTIRLWLGRGRTDENRFDHFDEIVETRHQEANEFYQALTPAGFAEDAAMVVRQGCAGMLWGKQVYLYDGRQWLADRNVDPRGDGPASSVRNVSWDHMQNSDVISMPDKWEYPWFAAWDLAFQAVALSFVDPDFAADQLDLILNGHYLHPNGQLPAYEWNFGDVNPPVHAWAVLFTYRLQRRRIGERAINDLRQAFHKLLLNFTWWLNRKDREGRNLFEGGFLGLDNIGVFDRSSPLPTGGFLEQADGTAWMALFSQNMLEIAIELALRDPVYEEMAVKFYEHAVQIAAAMDRTGEHRDEMWDEEDGFFYDVLRLPDGKSTRLKVRSAVGLLPLCATTVYSGEAVTKLPKFAAAVREFHRTRPELFHNISSPEKPGVAGRHILAIADETKLRRILARVLNPDEFLADHGIRALSRYHRDHPFLFRAGDAEYRVGYLPADSDSGMFGGNSNWRGPIWVPVNVLLIRALMQFYSYYGDDFRVECPTGSGNQMTLFEVARELSDRMAGLFLRNEDGRRPVYGGTRVFQEDPNWRNLILFYEYFHGDNGAGIGASHQTGWTALVASIMALFGWLTPQQALEDMGTVFDFLATMGSDSEPAIDRMDQVPQVH